MPFAICYLPIANPLAKLPPTSFATQPEDQGTEQPPHGFVVFLSGEVSTSNVLENMSEPEAKRARVGNSFPRTDASDREKEEKDTIPPPSSWIDLPAELWATHILIFLPYADMIRSSIVSKTFLKEFAPRIKEIDIESPHEMKAAVAKRFRSVETMRIRCLFSHGGDFTDEDDEDSDLIVEHEVVGLIAPFLAYFPALRLAQVGIFDPEYRDYGALESAHRRTDERDRLMQSLHTSICGVYRAGSISFNVEIVGADCPCQNYGHEDESDDENVYHHSCGLCIDYCKSYPMATVADTSHCKQFPVCLSIQDTIGLILKRPGGREYLTSSEYFIRKHIDLAVRDSALVRVLRDMGLVPKKITRQDVEDVLKNEKGYSIAHTCNEQELSFFHESGITCLERSDFRSVRPVAPTDSRGIWW